MAGSAPKWFALSTGMWALYLRAELEDELDDALMHANSQHDVRARARPIEPVGRRMENHLEYTLLHIPYKEGRGRGAMCGMNYFPFTNYTRSAHLYVPVSKALQKFKSRAPRDVRRALTLSHA